MSKSKKLTRTLTKYICMQKRIIRLPQVKLYSNHSKGKLFQNFSFEGFKHGSSRDYTSFEPCENKCYSISIKIIINHLFNSNHVSLYRKKKKKEKSWFESVNTNIYQKKIATYTCIVSKCNIISGQDEKSKW